MDKQELAEVAQFFQVSTEWLISNGASILFGLMILLIGWRASAFLAKQVRTLLPRSGRVDATIAPLLAQVVRYGVLIMAIVVAAGQFGVQTTSILAVLGAAGLAIALALQGTLSNIAAGVMLIWLRPMALGEYVEANGTNGTVEEIGLFATQLLTPDGVFVFVPNSKIWDSAIFNYHREPRRRVEIRFGISYDADIALTRKVVLDIANGDLRVLSDPAARVHVENMGASAIEMLFRCWTSTQDYWDVKFDFNEAIKLALDEHKIEIPYDKLDVKLVNPEAFQAKDRA